MKSSRIYCIHFEVYTVYIILKADKNTYQTNNFLNGPQLNGHHSQSHPQLLRHRRNHLPENFLFSETHQLHYQNSLYRMGTLLIILYFTHICIYIFHTEMEVLYLCFCWRKDPEGVLGPPSTGHIARREFQRRLEKDAGAREEFKRQVLEEKERLRNLRDVNFLVFLKFCFLMFVFDCLHVYLVVEVVVDVLVFVWIDCFRLVWFRILLLVWSSIFLILKLRNLNSRLRVWDLGNLFLCLVIWGFRIGFLGHLC